MLYPLMRIGRDISGSISEVIGGLKNPESIQGVILEYDTFWLRYVKEHLQAYRLGYPWHHFHPEEYSDWVRWWTEAIEGLTEKPERLRPPFWNDYCRMNGIGEGAGPVIIRFILRDPKALDEFNDNLRVLPGFEVRAEVRPQCRAYAVATPPIRRVKRSASSIGVAVPTRTSGTLGGVLRDRAQSYLISCAHVLTDTVGTDVFIPSPLPRAGSAKRVATVSYGTMPPAIASGVRCNNQSSPEASVDATAAEVDKAVSIPSSVYPVVNAVRPINTIWQGDNVWFTGARSGQVKAQIGGLCLWYEIEMSPGHLRCFGNIFEVKPPKPWYLNTNLARPGDSGAWILGPDSTFIDWNGMLIGGDGATVYCTFAEKIMDAFRTGGLRLTV
jgi:hypothetical protein